MIKFPHDEASFSDAYPQMYDGKQCKTVTFIVTHACQLRCEYCYQHNKAQRSMSFDTAKKCIDLLFEEDAKDSNYINDENTNGIILDFIGGEPLLEIALIDQIIDYFILKALQLNHRWAIRHMISMSSNGVAYFEPDVQKFLEKHKGRVNIGITIDGNKELHDKCRLFPNGQPSYDLAAMAFSDAKVRFRQNSTKMTIAKSNLPYLSTACKDMIEKFDLKYLHGNPIFEDEWTNEDAYLYYSQLKNFADWMIDSGRWGKTWVAFFDEFVGHLLSDDDNRNFCGGNGAMLAFDVDGTCYPCLRYSPVSMPEEISKQFIIGHCDTGLEATKCQHDCVSCIQAITRRSQSTDECWNCPIASGCAWCTAYNAEASGGDPDVRCTNICPMHKARVMATSYYYNTLYKKFNEGTRFHLNIPAEWAIPIVGQDEYDYLLSLSR